MQLTWVGGSIGEGPIRNRSILLNIAARKAKVYVVERVECVHTELEVDALFDREVLLHGYIRVEEMRPEDAVTARSSYLIKGCRRKPRPQRLSIVVGKTMAGISGDVFLEQTRTPVGVTWRRARNTCIARAIGERKWKTARVIEDRTDLPASHNLVYNRVRMGKDQLIAAEWQFKQTVDDDLLLTD